MRFIDVARTVSIALTLLSAGVAGGQAYPSRPIRLVVPGTGGGSDLMARVIAQAITGPLGQPVVVHNRPTGVIPGDTVAKAQPDGYTMLLSGSGLWLAPLLQDKVPFDPVKDFAPVTLAVSQPNVLAVNPSVATSVKELIAVAKAKPGALNYASGSTGSPNHMAAELFKSMAGVNIVRVNYAGAGAMITALAAGEVQVLFVTAAGVAAQAKAGRVRALAVTSAKPSALLPDLPTIAASGLPGYESASVYGIFVPAKTAKPIIARLNHEIVQALNQREMKEKLLSMGSEAVGSSPEQLGATVKADMAVSAKIIKSAGIHEGV